MAWLLEDPWTLIGFGLVVELLLAVALFHTRHGKILIAMGGVLAAVLLGLAIEWFVVTEVEEVENTIYAAAKAVEAGDEEQILGFIAPDAKEIRAAVKKHLRQFDVTEAQVYAMEVKVQGVRTRTAVAAFTAQVSLTGNSVGDRALGEMLWRFEVELRKVDDRWLITGYQQGRVF